MARSTVHSADKETNNILKKLRNEKDFIQHAHACRIKSYLFDEKLRAVVEGMWGRFRMAA